MLQLIEANTVSAPIVGVVPDTVMALIPVVVVALLYAITNEDPTDISSPKELTLPANVAVPFVPVFTVISVPLMVNVTASIPVVLLQVATRI